jgi:hypothetical protein
MKPFAWVTGRFTRTPEQTDFDATTRALVEPGRQAFRDLFADDAPIAHVAASQLVDVERDLTGALANAAPGDTITVEIPNARAAAIDGLAIGTTVTELTDAFRHSGLDVVDACGIGYIPKAIAKGKAFHRELISNPGVYATPADCVLLAFRGRVPLDART